MKISAAKNPFFPDNTYIINKKAEPIKYLLSLEPIDMEKYDFIRLPMKENWVVLLRPDDPLAEKSAVTAEDLAALPLILPRRMGVQNELASWFGDCYEKLNVVHLLFYDIRRGGKQLKADPGILLAKRLKQLRQNLY